MTLRRFLLSVPVLLAASAGTGARAVPVISNGSFESTPGMTVASQMNTTNVSNWSTSGYNFIFFPGTATTTGSLSTQYGPLVLQGTLPNGVTSNGFPATSPDGGNFVGADGDFSVGAITQTVTGLTAGVQYAVSFWWAAAQQKGTAYTSATTEQWQVTLGSELHSTPIVNNPAQGFTGWMQQKLVYTATSTSEVLSFLAAGTPSGAPPFSLLDGVSITAVAEPASWMTLVVAVLSIIGVAHLKRRASRLAMAQGEAQPAKPRRRRRRSYAHGAAC